MAHNSLVKMAKSLVKKPKLKNKPSQIIRQALDDLALVEKNKQYKIAMNNTFHEYFPKGMSIFDDGGEKTVTKPFCEVCFAGAVMAAAGNSAEMNLMPFDFGKDIGNKLMALDYFRTGSIYAGFETMGLKPNRWIAEYVNITPYSVNKAKFKKDMNEMADNFEKFGL